MSSPPCPSPECAATGCDCMIEDHHSDDGPTLDEWIASVARVIPWSNQRVRLYVADWHVLQGASLEHCHRSIIGYIRHGIHVPPTTWRELAGSA